MNLLLLAWPTRSRLGLQANWIIGGGPHIRMKVSSLGGGKWSLTMSSLMKPWLYSQSEAQGKSGESLVKLKGTKCECVKKVCESVEQRKMFRTS